MKKNRSFQLEDMFVWWKRRMVCLTQGNVLPAPSCQASKKPCTGHNVLKVSFRYAWLWFHIFKSSAQEQHFSTWSYFLESMCEMNKCNTGKKAVQQQRSKRGTARTGIYFSRDCSLYIYNHRYHLYLGVWLGIISGYNYPVQKLCLLIRFVKKNNKLSKRKIPQNIPIPN